MQPHIAAQERVNWNDYLADRETEAELTTIPWSTHTGRPLGSAEFINSLEQATLRCLQPQKRGPNQGCQTERSTNTCVPETTLMPCPHCKIIENVPSFPKFPKLPTFRRQAI